jgi:hypothetical protein
MGGAVRIDWNKDVWILRAIEAGKIRPLKDGTIYRPGVVGLETIIFSTHKPSGRVYFTLTFEGISKSVGVPRVLALAFLPNPLNLPQVNHITGNKGDNWIERLDRDPICSLEWSTKADNEKHAHGTGLKTARGTANGNAKLTVAQVLKIRAAPTDILNELAQSENVTRKTIDDIRERRTWQHI